MPGILVIFDAVSFRDAWLFHKYDGDSRRVWLQLPDQLKTMTHIVMPCFCFFALSKVIILNALH